MAIPTKDALLVPFSTNFDTRINQSPAVFGLTTPQADNYSGLNTQYVAAYQAVMDAKAAGVKKRGHHSFFASLCYTLGDTRTSFGPDAIERVVVGRLVEDRLPGVAAVHRVVGATRNDPTGRAGHGRDLDRGTSAASRELSDGPLFFSPLGLRSLGVFIIKPL